MIAAVQRLRMQVLGMEYLVQALVSFFDYFVHHFTPW